MNDLAREEDGELPRVGATSSDWRWFAFRNLGQVHFDYLDQLCKKFGADWVVDQEPSVFLSHVAMVGFENDRRGRWTQG